MEWFRVQETSFLHTSRGVFRFDAMVSPENRNSTVIATKEGKRREP